MHAAYEDEDERVLQHAGEEELACIVVSTHAEEARMVAVVAEVGHPRVEPANKSEAKRS